MESPSMAEVGPPVILSLGVAGYCSVRRTLGGVRLRLLLAMFLAGATAVAALERGLHIRTWSVGPFSRADPGHFSRAPGAWPRSGC